MLLNNPESCVDPFAGQSVVLRQIHAGVQPELCFAAGVLDVHVGSWLFAGEEVKPVAPNSQNGRTHDSCMSSLPITSPSGLRRFYTGPVPGGRVMWPGGEPGSRGTTLDSAEHDVVGDAGQRSRTKSGIEDPGRRAGPKVSDEERRGVNAGLARHGRSVGRVRRPGKRKLLQNLRPPLLYSSKGGVIP